MLLVFCLYPYFCFTGTTQYLIKEISIPSVTNVEVEAPGQELEWAEGSTTSTPEPRRKEKQRILTSRPTSWFRGDLNTFHRHTERSRSAPLEWNRLVLRLLNHPMVPAHVNKSWHRIYEGRRAEDASINTTTSSNAVKDHILSSFTLLTLHA